MIIRPFNAGFFLLVAIMIGAIVLLWALLHGQPERWRAAVLITLCMVNIIGFFVYKWFLSGDAEFLQVSGLDKFNWFNELPLQLCNINMFLIPIGILTHRAPCSGLPFSSRRSVRSWRLCFRRRHFPAIRSGRRASSAFISRTCLSSFAASAWPHLGFTGHGPKTCRVSRVHF